MKRTAFIVAILTILLYLAFRLSSIQSNAFSMDSLNPFNNNLLPRKLGPITLKLPKSTTISEGYAVEDRSEVQYSTYFFDSELGFRGYVQTWVISDLEQFLKTSKELSMFEFTTYDLQLLDIHGDTGFLNKWTANFGHNYRISAREYWIRKDNQLVLRISFFVDKESWPKNLDKTVSQIVLSSKWNEQ